MSDSIPPIQGQLGGGSIPPKIGHQMPSGPAPRKNNTGVIVGLVILVAVLISCTGLVGFGAYRANHSGVVVNGVELTRKEVKTAEEEIKTMMSSVNPQNLAMLNTDFVASNALSQLVKGYFVELKAAEVDLNLVVDKINVDGILGSQLGTQAGRQKSRQEAKQVDVAILKYCDRQMKAINNFQTQWGNAFHLSTTFGADSIARFQKTQDTYRVLSKTRLDLISLADVTKPSTDGKLLLFQKDSEITQYNKLTDHYNVQFEAFQKAAAEMSKAGSAQFSKSLNSLN